MNVYEFLEKRFDFYFQLVEESQIYEYLEIFVYIFNKNKSVKELDDVFCV